MGHDLSLQLRQDSLMTKIMLKKEQQVIEHIEQQKIELNRPINQMGDTLLHYAAYKSMKKMMQYLLEHDADPFITNNRYLNSIDVSLPHTREWLIKRHHEIQQDKKHRPKQQQKSQTKTIRSPKSNSHNE